MVIRIVQYMVDPSVSSSHFDSPRHNITISGSRSKRVSLYCLWLSLLEKVMNPVSGRRTHLSVTAQLLVEMLSSFHFVFVIFLKRLRFLNVLLVNNTSKHPFLSLSSFITAFLCFRISLSISLSCGLFHYTGHHYFSS